MDIWGFLGKYIKVIYRIMFIVGFVLAYLSYRTGVFSWQLVLSSFPIVGGIAAAYLWIRIDVWHTDETINELVLSNKTAKDELKSRRADSRVAIGLLFFVAVAQSSLQYPELNCLVIFGVLFILVPFSNWITKLMEGKKWMDIL